MLHPRLRRSKTSADCSNVAAPQRWTSDAEHRDMRMMDKLLFEDDTKSAEFLKSLISANGLRDAWADVLKRMRACEDTVRVVVGELSSESLREEFVSWAEYTETVKGTHSSEIRKCRDLLARDQADMAVQTRQLEKHSRCLDGCQERLVAQEQSWALLSRQMEQLEAQVSEQHQVLIKGHEEMWRETRETRANMQGELHDLKTRFRKEENLRVAIADELATQKKFIFGEKLMEHITTVLRPLLSQYIRKDEIMAETSQALNTILDPVVEGQARLTKDFGHNKLSTRERFETVEEMVKKVQHRLTEDVRQLARRTDDILGRIELCATMKCLQDRDTVWLNKLKQAENASKEAKQASMNRFEESASRLLEFQTMLEDHEHALQHQAEELMNRSTKYDLVLCERRIDDCATRDKVETDFKELRRVVTWLSSKFEKLGIGQGLSGMQNSFHTSRVPSRGPSRQPSKTRSTCDPVADACTACTGETKLVFDGLAPEEGVFSTLLDTDGLATTTEHLNLLRMQLEHLAQGVLGLGHMLFRGIYQPASSREERQLREADMIHHLPCTWPQSRDLRLDSRDLLGFAAHRAVRALCGFRNRHTEGEWQPRLPGPGLRARLWWLSSSLWKAPASWDPGKLTSLVMSSPVPGDADRRRTPLQQMQQAPVRTPNDASASPTSSRAPSVPLPAAATSATTPMGSRSARRKSKSQCCADQEQEAREADALPQASKEALRAVGPGRPTSGPTPTPPASASSAVQVSAARPQLTHTFPSMRARPATTPRSGGGFCGQLRKRRVPVPTDGPVPKEPEPTAPSAPQAEALPPFAVADIPAVPEDSDSD